MNDQVSDAAARPERKLSLWDCTSILVGIIIGSGIYESAGLVAAQVTTVPQLAGVWIAGALFALLGALCYAELATRFPEQGGDYVYLSQAFGKPVGFLFAWTQLWVIRPGSIGALACVFATYAAELSTLIFDLCLRIDRGADPHQHLGRAARAVDSEPIVGGKNFGDRAADRRRTDGRRQTSAP